LLFGKNQHEFYGKNQIFIVMHQEMRYNEAQERYGIFCTRKERRMLIYE